MILNRVKSFLGKMDEARAEDDEGLRMGGRFDAPKKQTATGPRKAPEPKNPAFKALPDPPSVKMLGRAELVIEYRRGIDAAILEFAKHDLEVIWKKYRDEFNKTGHANARTMMSIYASICAALRNLEIEQVPNVE